MYDGCQNIAMALICHEASHTQGGKEKGRQAWGSMLGS